jgi:hypothetical protein
LVAPPPVEKTHIKKRSLIWNLEHTNSTYPMNRREFHPRGENFQGNMKSRREKFQGKMKSRREKFQGKMKPCDDLF